MTVDDTRTICEESYSFFNLRKERFNGHWNIDITGHWCITEEKKSICVEINYTDQSMFWRNIKIHHTSISNHLFGLLKCKKINMIKKRRWQTENTDDPASFFKTKLDPAMRKPLACMRGFRGGVGEIGAGSGPSLWKFKH